MFLTKGPVNVDAFVRDGRSRIRIAKDRLVFSDRIERSADERRLSRSPFE